MHAKSAILVTHQFRVTNNTWQGWQLIYRWWEGQVRREMVVDNALCVKGGVKVMNKMCGSEIVNAHKGEWSGHFSLR